MLVLWLSIISCRGKTIKQFVCVYRCLFFSFSTLYQLFSLYFLTSILFHTKHNIFLFFSLSVSLCPLQSLLYCNSPSSSSVSINRKPVNMNKTPITYRQEKSHMGSMERSFTDQSTLQEDERMALSFMDAHTCGTRSKKMHSGLPLTVQCTHTYHSLPQLHNAISKLTHIIPLFAILLTCQSFTLYISESF